MMVNLRAATPAASVPSVGVQAMSVGASALGIGTSALYGGGIGYVASSSTKGALTGALAGATVSALTYGSFLLFARAWVPGAILAAAGLGGGYYTYRRYKRGR